MFILIVFAFIAGVVTILSPCILPILPIVLSGSITGGKSRPFGIVTGFIGSFTFFTLLLSTIVKATGLSPDFLRTIAICTIGIFGITLIYPKTQILLEQLFAKLSFLSSKAPTNRSGFWGGVLIGLSLGLLWAPCVGPILASVITLAITSSVTASAFFITLAYSIGTAIPMLVITLSGRKLFTSLPWLTQSTGKIQQIFGVLMVLIAVAMFFNIDRRFQTFILETFPQYGTGLTKIEDNSLVRQQLSGTTVTNDKDALPVGFSGLPYLGEASGFAGGTGWLNSAPLELVKDLRGKVVLVDFWTYSCINCIRTLPYLRSWHDTYSDKGLVIVGVHSPEFEFEKKKENVEMAIKDFEIKYPVVLDNNFTIWRAYRNQYWPAKYLIDHTGQIRYTHFGEGEYAKTERYIQALLEEAGMDISTVSATQTREETNTFFGPRLTPETYLGYERAQHYTDSQNKIIPDTETTYIFNKPLAHNEVGLQGKWIVENERITSVSDTSSLTLRFTATKVYLVMSGSNKNNIPVTVKLNGKEVNSEVVTSDFNMSGGISVAQDRKYDIVDIHGPIKDHTLELTIPNGISAYAFTFGK